MATPYVEEFALVSKNNEAISQVIYLRKNENGIITPVDLTDRLFFAQARRAKSTASDLMCDIDIEVLDPLEGMLRLFVSETVVADIAPGKGHYDLLTKAGPTSPVDNLFMAPFIIEGGVSQW